LLVALITYELLLACFIPFPLATHFAKHNVVGAAQGQVTILDFSQTTIGTSLWRVGRDYGFFRQYDVNHMI